MSPSTSRPQDALKRPPVGTFTCMVCVPNVRDKGGQREFNTHYNREHLNKPLPGGSAWSKRTPRPA